MSMKEKEVDIVELKKNQLRKSVLSYAVLLSIGNKKSYASNILKELKAANLLVVEGTVYPLLSRFNKEGLVVYEWEESKKGPPRKYYKLTKKGIDMSRYLDGVWESLEVTIKLLKNKK